MKKNIAIVMIVTFVLALGIVISVSANKPDEPTLYDQLRYNSVYVQLDQTDLEEVAGVVCSSQVGPELTASNVVDVYGVDFSSALEFVTAVSADCEDF